MKLSLQGKIFLICNEGIALSPYLDSVGVKTLAIGATVTELPDIASMPWDHTITLQEALDLLDVSLKRYEDAVNTVLSVAITQNQFDSLVSLCYNIGTGHVSSRVGGIAGSTVIKRINSGEPASSISQAILMWNKPPEIIPRRTREAKLYTNGFYGKTRASLIYVDPATHKEQPSKSKIIDLAVLLQQPEPTPETPTDVQPVVVTPAPEPTPSQVTPSALDVLVGWVKEHWLI